MSQTLYETANRRNSDKTLLRERIMAMRSKGMSYRQIGTALGIHHTRVWQIAKNTEQHE
jgi:DNA-binding CsgD family transcriptional regulator